MAINLKFDLMGNPEPPSIVLANRNGNKLGQLNVNVESIDVSDKFNTASEFSFTLNKYIDGEPTPLWNKVVDFKLVYCPEWDMWFEIKVELDETTETVKTVFCTQLGQAELSQIKVYNIHINEEGDPNWDTNNETYKSTILYDKEHIDASLLHRLLKDKAPHYSIAYVDESIQRIQKTFSFDDTSICDAFNEIAEEVGCLFVYNSNSTKGGKPSRTISVYDLQQNCLNPNCKHRGEFTDVCPKCNSRDDEGNKYGVKYGYGEDTTIFVTSDELATEGIQLVTDVDSVKNCFKLEGGDDLMTATIRNCNPNGSDYIWYFSDALKEDMSKELVNGIDEYDKDYQYYYNEYISELNEDIVGEYNKLVEDFDEDDNLIGGYSRFYDTRSTCLSCGKEDYFEKKCPNCGSENILSGQKLQTISTKIKGYPDLMTSYYNTIDLLLYLKSGLMPNVEIGEKSLCLDCNHEGVFAKVCPKCNGTNILSGAKYQLHLLTTSFPSTVAVNVDDVEDVSLPTANSAVLSMAKVIVKSTYKVEVIDDSSYIEDGLKDEDGNVVDKLWTGKFKITNYSDEEDYATSEEIVKIVNNDTETFIKQKINKALNKENTDDYSVTGLFAKKLNVDADGNHILEDGTGICRGAETLDENGEPLCPFCAEIKKYALNPLDNFSKACDAVIGILAEQGVGDDGSNENNEIDKATKKALYDALYKPYFEKQQAINKEIAIRKNEIAIIEGVWDKSDEDNPRCTTNGLQQYIEDCQRYIQDKLNFEAHLGENLWLEFCAYRREDKYSNSNYVSDGLNNAELFDRALEFIEVAEEEIFKSAELQHSISATLNNLLSLPKFKPLLKSFKTGNWIRVQVDDKVYKLRLLEYGFGYGDSESISVEFSDVTKIKNGVTDVKEVLEQASSMASSYDSVQRQAEKGNVARSTIDQWLVDGLNAANMQIASNDSEEVLLTKSGLLARSYDDITGTYSPEQLKITHNIMAYTDDNWKTVRQSIGKHEYNYFNEDTGKLDKTTGYGMNADFSVASIISGSQMIGGNIYSTNYSKTTNEKGEISEIGSHIDLETGSFSLAGGRLKYDGKDTLTVVGKMEITNSGKIACWDIDEYALYKNKYPSNSSELSFYNADTMYFGEQGLSLGDKFKVEPNGIATMTNANVSGTITASDIIGGTITGTEIKGGTITAGNALYIGSQKDEDGNIIENSHSAWIDVDGILHTNDAHINGTITAIDGMIGGFNIEPTIIEEGVVKSGGILWSGELQEGQTSIQIGDDKSIFLSATNMSGAINSYNKENWRLTVGGNFGVTSDGTTYATNAILNDCTITSGTLQMGTYEDGYSVWISAEEGILNAYGANISGTITAVNGAIAGWQINGDEICQDSVGMYSGDNHLRTSLVVDSNKSPIRFYAGRHTSTVTVIETTTSNPQTFIYSPEDCTTMLSATYSVSNGGGGGSFSGIDTDTLTFTWSGSIGAILTITYTYVTSYPFTVLADGSLYASAANITGSIYATDGSISLNEAGLTLTSSTAKIIVGNTSLGYDDTGDTVLQTSQALRIKGENDTHILLMDDDSKVSGNVYVEYQRDTYIPQMTIKAKLSKPCLYPFEYKVHYKHATGSEYTVNTTATYTFTFESGATESSNTIVETSSPTEWIDYVCFYNPMMGGWLYDWIEFNPGKSDSEFVSYLIDTFSQEIPSNYVKIQGHLIPQVHSNAEGAGFDLGFFGNKWNNVYARVGRFNQLYSDDPALSPSDRHKKNTISTLSNDYDLIFDKLRPVTFKYNQGTSDRLHTGFIAQEVKDAVEKSGLTMQDFAAYCEWEDENKNATCGLRYSEFVALCVDQIQKLKKRVAELENK